ncbi:MAG: hypothetical protein ABEJ28_04395 [Salinigranum sp.]
MTTTHGGSRRNEESPRNEERRGTLPRSRPIALWLYVLGAIGLGVSALFGGGSLLADPTGSTMNMPVEWLAGTPFRDYTIPGAILFGAFGVGSGVVLYGIARRREWAWIAAVCLGAGQVGWIVVQVLLLGTVNVLHFVYGGLGLALAALALLPSVREDLRG